MSLSPTDQPGGQSEEKPPITLAKWSTRFWAWLVDAIIVDAALGVVFGILSIPMWLYGFANPGMMFPMSGGYRFAGFWGPFTFGVNSLVFFLYWTYMESRHNGQSIGKMLLHIRTTDLQGKPADVRSIAISSFGKAFILVIDVLLGWIFTNDKRQRLLNRASNTIVIKVTEGAGTDVKYVKE